ncbi:hypothetical protein GOP47_0016125 [Adiantum capillus-veneris]|uniref:Protein TIC 20 n=1 Tax=Adiantum capillus-veneris TaxID=13818 RepID=A0A9D4ULJ9_ADICA|nr:hypothetical protein GOP47_0016125 [Adiantum capillus-veneris]
MAYIVRCEGMARASSASSSIAPLLPSLQSFFSQQSRRKLSSASHRGSKSRPLRLTVYAEGRRGDGITTAERIVAASAYLLPFLDGVQYGRYFLTQFPQAQAAFRPLYPLLRVYSSTPFASVAVFFGLYFLVVRNPSFNRYVRYNTMQAVMLDILLILPSLIEGIYHPQSGVGLEILVVFYNTVFFYLVACFLIGSGSCLLGKTPRLPLVADAADAQVM